MVRHVRHDETCPVCAEPAQAYRIVDVLAGERAIVDAGEGKREEISTMLVDAALGDVVLVQAGEAIAVVGPTELG